MQLAASCQLLGSIIFPDGRLRLWTPLRVLLGTSDSASKVFMIHGASKIEWFPVPPMWNCPHSTENYFCIRNLSSHFVLFFLKALLLCAWMFCLWVCTHMHWVHAGASGDQQRAPDPLELESRRVVSCYCGCSELNLCPLQVFKPLSHFSSSFFSDHYFRDV